MKRMIHLAVVALLFPAVTTSAGDWPQLLGPSRDGRAADDEKVAATFVAGEPRVLWKKEVGEGYAGPMVVRDTVFVFHRVGDEDVVEALKADNGGILWRTSYPTDYRDGFGFDNGPRAVPTFHDGYLYIHGAQGLVHCLDASTGKLVWRVDTAREYGSGPGFFGRACSPLIVGDLVVLNVGGPRPRSAGIIALDRRTGGLKWKATAHEASYSSPIALEVGGKERIAVFTREGLVLLDPRNGDVLLEQRWRSPIEASVNAATPLFVDDTLFLTAAYRTGAIALQLKGDLSGGAKKLWSSDEVLSSHFGTPVHHEGFIFGFHGRQDIPPPAELRCVELQTGKVRWAAEPMGVGHIILVDGKLVILLETGELVIAPATADGFKPTARAKILDHGIRAYPALSNGRLYARDEHQLICVKLD